MDHNKGGHGAWIDMFTSEGRMNSAPLWRQTRHAITRHVILRYAMGVGQNLMQTTRERESLVILTCNAALAKCHLEQENQG